jgi:hypothetical protein
MSFLVFIVNYHETFQDNDDEGLISAMGSLIVSSPPRKPAPLVSPRTTPGKRQKYYVVSAGKRTGVFDSWFVLSLSRKILTHLTNRIGHMFIVSQPGSAEAARSHTRRTMRRSMFITSLRQMALSGLSGIEGMRPYLARWKTLWGSFVV